MKHPFKPLATALAATLQLAAVAAVPVAWTNSPGMPPYPIKPVPHGSTVDLAVTLKGYTTPPIADGADVRLWYQTNGMGSAWWSAPATFDGSTITATFGPAQDCGADRVSLFFGAPSNVFASAVLRLTHAPGFSPSSLPLPVPALDFATVELRNISALTNGWSFGSTIDLTDSTNYTDSALGAFAATGTVVRASSYGTPTRWTDSTGCVWEVMLNVWVDHAEGNVFRGGTSIFPSEGEGDMRGYLYYDPAAMEYVGGTGGGWYYNGSNSGGTPGAVFVGGPDATSLDNGRFTFGNFTNLVGRVARTSDLPPTISNVVTKSYVEALGILSEEADPVWIADKPNYATKAALKSTVDLARARHDYRWAARQGVLYRIDFDADGYQYLTPVTNVNALAEGNEHILIHLEEQRHGNAD